MRTGRLFALGFLGRRLGGRPEGGAGVGVATEVISPANDEGLDVVVDGEEVSVTASEDEHVEEVEGEHDVCPDAVDHEWEDEDDDPEGAEDEEARDTGRELDHDFCLARSVGFYFFDGGIFHTFKNKKIKK